MPTVGHQNRKHTAGHSSLPLYWSTGSRGFFTAPNFAERDGGVANTTIVYVIDDDESMRASLDTLFRSVGLRVETFASPQAFLEFKKSKVPSCLILDVRLRSESGLSFQQEIITHGLHMPILFMTGYGDMEMCVKAMKAGALDFFSKPFRDQDMLDAVSQALARDRQRLAAEESIASLRAAYASLSGREQQVMALVTAGLMNKQIAAEMLLSEITVKVYRGQLMKKMKARSVADLVRKAEALRIESNQEKAL
jgi:FixJ family two-component response regulator